MPARWGSLSGFSVPLEKCLGPEDTGSLSIPRTHPTGSCPEARFPRIQLGLQGFIFAHGLGESLLLE